MGSDDFGNRYYENRVDYPWGQHRWVEPADIHNFDASHIPPEWHGWMTHMNDATPVLEDSYFQQKTAYMADKKGEVSHTPFVSNVGHQEPIHNFHGMHNQSQIRSRGYQIGNNVVGLPPGAPDGYYTQPGSPYNPQSIRDYKARQGSLDENGGRAYRNDLWKERLQTAEEKQAEKDAIKKEWQRGYEKATAAAAVNLSPREQAIAARGGTIAAAQK